MIEQIIRDEIGLGNESITAVHLRKDFESGCITIDEVREIHGEAVARILLGLKRISDLYKKNPVVESENFRNLLLSFAEDMRVILIMIADRVAMLRQYDSSQNSIKEVEEAAYLYAPLAHKLGLYKLKSELEDLSLKFLEHDAYYHIKEKLNATKQARDTYISNFIKPINDKLCQNGLKFHIKGRTKSIHSIWQKMKKQKCAFEGIYDLFAIRIIIDAPIEKEKMYCWQVYSLITDMYQPNPKRMRDWLSVPKSNGYESLHITVLGPDNKWVEVQIRSERMDQIAERGVAAHWRYKGIKSASTLDDWLSGIRAILESADGAQAMDQFKMDLAEDEVYVFTPKGDLLKFPKCSTVLDFAYHIHSKIGNSCTGARINNKVVSIREQLKSGDQVEIITSVSQKPKRDWLAYVHTSRAKSKIRLALKETQVKDGLFAKEILERKFKNRKIELEESILARLITKLGYKEVSDFYKHIVDGELDINTLIEGYQNIKNKELNPNADIPTRSAEEYEFNAQNQKIQHADEDVLVIGQDLKGLDYQLAHCCRPIYGDPVFGFVTVNGGIRIHRDDCPNAPELRKRFGYRIVKARWSGKGSSQYSITLRVVGNDDLGIVNNLTSIISKDEKLILRSISIDSNDGLFSGNIVVMLDDTSRLETLIRKLRNVKGVKAIERI